MAETQYLTQVAAPDSKSVSVTVLPPLDGDGFIAKYVTFPHNLPATYSNKIFAWDAEGAIVPWKQPTNADAAVPTDSLAGDAPVLMSVQKRGYIIGYAVAPNKEAVCSTCFIPASGHSDPETWQYNHLKISVPVVGIDSIMIKYEGLANYDPAANKNWIGIWRKNEVPYSGDAMRMLTITNPASDGTTFMSGLDLKINNEYAVGYFMQPLDKNGRTSLGAEVTFRV